VESFNIGAEKSTDKSAKEVADYKKFLKIEILDWDY